MELRRYKSAFNLAMGIGMAAAGMFAQQPVSSDVTSAKTVVLSQGNCTSVATGDFITLAWNPGFSPAVSSGPHRMTLIFAPSANLAGKNGIPYGGFVLEALAAKPKHGVDTPIAALQNGFFLFMFRANLEAVQPGQYTLVDASADPEGGTATVGDASVMINSPKNSFFCLEVTGSVRSKS